MTARQKIDRAREARLWLGQIIGPTAVTVVGLMQIPEFREAAKAKARQIRYDAEHKINKLKNIRK